MLMMILFLIIGVSELLAGIATVVIMVTLYIVWGVSRHKKRVALLIKDYDPDAFIEATKRQQEIMPKVAGILELDIAGGYISKGDFKEALDILDAIDRSKLKNNDYAYYQNLCIAFYGLGERKEAEKIYEEKLMTITPRNKDQVYSRSLLIAKYFFEKGDLETSEKVLTELISTKKLPDYIRLHVYYTMGLICEKKGELDSAVNHFKFVAHAKGKLYIMKMARERVEDSGGDNEKSIERSNR